MARAKNYQIYILLVHSMGKCGCRSHYYQESVARTKKEVRERYRGKWGVTVDKIYTLDEVKALNLNENDKKRVEIQIAIAEEYNKDLLNAKAQ